RRRAPCGARDESPDTGLDREDIDGGNVAASRERVFSRHGLFPTRFFCPSRGSKKIPHRERVIAVSARSLVDLLTYNRQNFGRTDVIRPRPIRKNRVAIDVGAFGPILAYTLGIERP